MKYTVKVANGLGEAKEVAKCGYKQDAIAIAQRFVNATVTRTGALGTRTVYSHNHSVKPFAKGIFTLKGVALARKSQ